MPRSRGRRSDDLPSRHGAEAQRPDTVSVPDFRIVIVQTRSGPRRIQIVGDLRHAEHLVRRHLREQLLAESVERDRVRRAHEAGLRSAIDMRVARTRVRPSSESVEAMVDAGLEILRVVA